MTYQRGVYISEQSTAISPMTEIASPVAVIGSASKGKVNEPVLIQSMSEFTEEFGFEDNFDKYTLEEAAYVFFQLYNVRPIICVNVFDKSKEAVTKADVLGTANGETGLYVLEKIYPKLQVVPSMVICPKWSAEAEVALAMAARCRSINGVFKAVALADIDGVTDYQTLNTYKTTHALQDEFLSLYWLKCGLSGKKSWLSTHAAARACLVDAGNDNIPYESPSNKALRIDSTYAGNTELLLSKDKANTIAGWGMVTAMNFNGWRLWSNRMSVYPTNDDPKDSWFPVRRMFNWVGNTLAINYFSRIDAPIKKRNVEKIVTEAQLWLNGLARRGALLTGSRIEFLSEENSVQRLIDGFCVFHVYLGCLVPARVIEFTLEFDVDTYKNLMS